MIFSASSCREIGVCPAGTFFSDLCCCSGASGCTHEKSSGHTKSQFVFGDLLFRPLVIFQRADDEFDFVGGFQMRNVFKAVAFSTSPLDGHFKSMMR